MREPERFTMLLDRIRGFRPLAATLLGWTKALVTRDTTVEVARRKAGSIRHIFMCIASVVPFASDRHFFHASGR